MKPTSRSRHRAMADRAKCLHGRMGTALGKQHDLHALGNALLHVLGDAKGRDEEPLVTAISIAGMIADQASMETNRIDEISLEFCAFCNELKVEGTP
jgi:hypothetical protein